MHNCCSALVDLCPTLSLRRRAGAGNLGGSTETKSLCERYRDRSRYRSHKRTNAGGCHGSAYFQSTQCAPKVRTSSIAGCVPICRSDRFRKYAIRPYRAHLTASAERRTGYSRVPRQNGASVSSTDCADIANMDKSIGGSRGAAGVPPTVAGVSVPDCYPAVPGTGAAAMLRVAIGAVTTQRGRA